MPHFRSLQQLQLVILFLVFLERISNEYLTHAIRKLTKEENPCGYGFMNKVSMCIIFVYILQVFDFR